MKICRSKRGNGNHCFKSDSKYKRNDESNITRKINKNKSFLARVFFKLKIFMFIYFFREGKRKEIVQKKEIPKKAKKEVYVVPKKRF